jgi:O-antigen/teichoic acid export membrane protein
LKLLNYNGDIVLVIYIIFISTIISSIKGVFDSIFQALEKPIYISIGKIFSTILLLFGVYLAIILKLSLIQFSVIYPIINSIILLFFIISTIKHIEIGKWLTFDFTYIKYILKESWPFAITYAFVSIYVWTDSIMLSIFKGEVEVGYYNVAYRMVLALLFIPVAFNVAVYPVLSRYYTTKSKKSINVIVEKYFSMMVLLGIPISIGTTILSSKIIEMIFGPEYAPAAVVLQILIWSLAFTYMNAPFVKLFESINLQILVTKITGFSALINVTINYLLIPKYSIIGASTATLITEGIVAISLILYSIKLGYFKLNYMEIFKIIIGSLFMGVFLIFINEWNIIISVVCSILLYILIVYLLKVIDKEDVILMKSVFKLG